MEAKRARVAELEAEMAEENFWSDRERAQAMSQEFSQLKEIVERWDGFLQEADELTDMFKVASAEDEIQLGGLLSDLTNRVEKRELEVLFAGKYDSRGAIVAIHAGTGGVDAMDWASMLWRMYTRFCDQQGWKVTLIDDQRGQEAGIKRVTFEVSGLNAYGHLRAEAGVHRLVRISPFDAEGMRHTSFALVEVLPDLGDAPDIVIKPEDIRIDVYRAGGHGGQSVNTTDSAVRITHLATGIVVTCQNERSQLQNKESAMKYLKAKLFQLSVAEHDEEKKQLRGEYSEAAWGNQIRSYVLNPYKLVKDHRTGHETADVLKVLDGDLLPFIESVLRGDVKGETTTD